jgi:uncharacterized cupredoxin-like copper-binding protein
MTDTLTPSDPPRADEPVDLDERVAALDRDLKRFRLSRDAWTLIIFAIAGIAAVASVVAIAFALSDDGGGGEGAAVAPIQAELSEFAIALSSPQIAEGGSIEVHNGGTMAHDIAIKGTDIAIDELQPGESATLDLGDLEPGTYEVWCTIAGHEASGMVASLIVGEGAAAGESAAAGHGDHATMTEEEAAALDAAMMDSALAFPAETEGVGNVPLEPEVLPDGTKRFELTASIVDWEVSPGAIVQAWAYNGIVPGPRIDVEVGDSVEVELTNELPLGTDIHWHGIDVPNDQDGVAPITQDLIAPGDTYTYRFTTTEAGIGMYHAHAHGHVAVPNGMFATIYVGDVEFPKGTTISGIEIPEDVELAQDIPMVLNDAGVIGLTLDGKSFPATAPIVVNEGDWFRVTYYNEGLQVHPMHLHGVEQLVVAKDGEPLDEPYAADTVLVAPGERFTVLVHADVPGTWVWHCHILNHVESEAGMFGMMTALIVQ